MARFLDYELIKNAFWADDDGNIFRRTTGKIATHNHGKYLRVWFNNRKYYAHHIIWYFAHNEWPSHIDHKDGNTKNNRLSNLRKCTMSQNIANANYGKLRGVEFHGNRARVRFQVNGVRVELGSYKTVEEAIEVAKAGYEKYFGEFAFHRR